MKHTPEDVEKYRFELAEELGIIEQAGGGRRTRTTVMKSRLAPHIHQKQKKETGQALNQTER